MPEKRKKWSPFGPRVYIASTFEVVCGCGVVHKIRTDKREQIITCWRAGCNRSIKIIMGYGRNNYAIYIVEGSTEKRVYPTAVWQ